MIHLAHSMAEVAPLARRYCNTRRPIARQSRRAAGGEVPIEKRLLGAVAGNLSLFMAHLGVSLVSGNVSNHADQSGTGDANKNRSQGTAGARPPWVASNANFAGRSTFTLDGARYTQSGTWAASQSQPLTWYTAVRCTSAAAGSVLHFSNGAVNYLYILSEAGTGNPRMNMGATITATNTWLNTTCIVCFVANGASSAIYVNNVTTASVTGNIGAGTMQGETLGATNVGSAGYVGQYGFDGMWSGAHNATQRGLIMPMAGAYYGVTVAP